MSTFKDTSKKSNKKPQKRLKNATLDVRHQNEVKYFQERSSSLPKLNNRIQKYQRELDNLERKNPSEYTNDDIKRKAYLKTEIDKMTREVNDIENKVEEMDYYSNTMDILVSYFDIIDNNVEKKDAKKVDIMDIFHKGKTKKEDDSQDRASLYDDWLKIVDGSCINKKHRPYIRSCDICDVEMILHHSDGFYTCTKCGLSEAVLVDSHKGSYKDPNPSNAGYAYKRLNHFNERISQFQGKESTEIPPEIYDKIWEEIHKRRITDLSVLNPKIVRKILKKLNLNQYYEHVPHIINKLNGLPPPKMSRETEERLRQMFKQIEEPWRIFCPADRKNFLSYNYVLHKFCELLELDMFLPCFPLLKSREKLIEQDRIWKNICDYLNWEFYSSI